MQDNQVVTLLLEERKKLTMNGVSSVDGFAEQYVKLTVAGSKVLVTGEKLKVVSFNKSTGALIVDGLVNEIKYLAKKQPLYKRIFK